MTVCIPRFSGIEKEADIFYSCPNKENLYCSLGLNDIDRIKAFNIVGCKNYLIDIASGYLPTYRRNCQLLVENSNIKKIILGNIVTDVGYYYLYEIAKKYNLPVIISVDCRMVPAVKLTHKLVLEEKWTELVECYEAKKIVTILGVQVMGD